LPHLVSLLAAAALLAAGLPVAADTVRLKNGRVIKGKVVRYGNGEFVVRAEGETRDTLLLIESIESIEFDTGGATPAAPAAPAATAEKVIVVDASQEVVASGVTVRKGDKVRITATGEMKFGDGRASGPKGLSTAESWPFPGERFGVLVALVGSPSSSLYHVIGEAAEFEASSDGQIFLQVNARSLQGASGAYGARIAAPGQAPATASTPATTPPAGSTSRQLRFEVTVPSERDWTDTGIDLLEGDTFRITAEGTINYTSSSTCGPEGGPRSFRDLIRVLPVNDVGRGALIGKLGEGGVVRAFYVGKSNELVAERKGRLFLGVNDDDYSNNRGSFKVKVEIVPPKP
jgi:hypothetical protein